MRAELLFFSLRPDWAPTFKLEENKYSQQMGQNCWELFKSLAKHCITKVNIILCDSSSKRNCVSCWTRTSDLSLVRWRSKHLPWWIQCKANKKITTTKHTHANTNDTNCKYCILTNIVLVYDFTTAAGLNEFRSI